MQRNAEGEEVAMAVELAGGSVPLMSMTDIAELAGVQRPVVSNWRRRGLSFPAPTDGDASQPLFEPRQVADWLTATGRVDRERAEQELSLYTLAGLAARYPGTDVIAAVTALICLRFLAGENEPLADGTDDAIASLRERASITDPNDGLLLSEVHGIPIEAWWLASRVDDLIEAAWGCQQAFERVMTARNRFRAGSLFADSVTPALARLIAEVSGATERARRPGLVVVTDPAAGAGDLLATVARTLGPDASLTFTGAEASPALARLVRRRLTVHGVQPTGMDIRVGTELPAEFGEPDVIVMQIPYQPGEERDLVEVLDLVDDVALQVPPGRFAVVLGPAAALAGDLPPFSPAERARAALLQGDMVEAIIRLPGGLVPFRPGYETALWVLAQARDSRWRGRVLIADVSHRELTDDVISDLVEDVVTWRRAGYVPGGHSRAFGVQVAVSDLIDPPRPLLVSRRPVSPRERATDANMRVTRVTQCGVDLDRIGASATAERVHVGTEVLAAADRRPATETVGALTRRRRLVIRKGTRISPTHIDAAGKHVVPGADEVLGLRRPGQRRVDFEVFVKRYPGAQLTEPGDVLVTMSPRTGAMVDHAGYSIAEFPVRVLRIPEAESEQFTPPLLAALLFADGYGGRPAGAVRPGQRLEDQRVVLLPPAEVRLLDTLLAEIDARRCAAQREIDVLEELRQVATGGLIDGTLTLASDDA
jgi:hypothetical protein